MKRFLSTILILYVIIVPINAQTTLEREIISKSYDKEAIYNVKEALESNFFHKEARINDYLKTSRIFSRTFKTKGKTYYLYDVIDGKPVYRTTHNLNSAKSTKTDKLQTGGSLGLDLEGTNMILAVWDEESVRGTHVEFKDEQIIPQSRVIYPEFPHGFFGPISDHATHVAGTLIANGTNSSAKGMAPRAILRSYDWGLDDQEALNEASNGLLISNHSYGIPIFNASNIQQINAKDIGAYTTDARLWDQISYASPYYLAVNSAGNDGSSTYTGGLAPGYDKLTGNTTAKNILVVANSNPSINPTTGTLINFLINSSSSQGPTDDFRIKPDIAGDGTNVFSAASTSDNAYATFSGTSMASPNVAGTLLLLQEYYNRLNGHFMKSATLKGLVCHTAIDNPTRIGPDPVFGWGLLDAEKAALVIQKNSNEAAVIKELTLFNNQTYSYEFFASAHESISATICWTDPPGQVQSNSVNSIIPRLVNDLDLRLSDPSNTVFLPWKLDQTNVAAAAIKGDNMVDNIERVDITFPEAGRYTLTVSHKGNLTNSAQNFSLIITGSNLTLDILDPTIHKISVWPNPVDDYINISFKSVDSNTNIFLYNTLGRIIYEHTIQSNIPIIEHSINTSNFSKGIYFLKIINGNSIYNKKIIIR